MTNEESTKLAGIVDKVSEFIEEKNWPAVLANLRKEDMVILFKALMEADISPFAGFKLTGVNLTAFIYNIYAIFQDRVPYGRLDSRGDLSPDVLDALKNILEALQIFNIYAMYNDEGIAVDYIYSIGPVHTKTDNITLVYKGLFNE